MSDTDLRGEECTSFTAKFTFPLHDSEVMTRDP